MLTVFPFKNLKKRDHSEDLSTDGRYYNEPYIITRGLYVSGSE